MANKLFKHSATRQEMFDFGIPSETSSYKPVPHQQIIESVLEGAYKKGIEITYEEFRANKNGKEVQGEFRLAYGDDRDMAPSLIFQNSYNKQLTLKVAVGISVFVCTNGACWGDMGNMRKKHVGEIQTVTPQSIQLFFDEVEQHYAPMVKRKDRMKTIDIDKHLTAELIGEMFMNEELINTEQLMIIRNEIKTPTFNYQAPGSLYEFWNHITHSYKTEHPSLYLKNQLGLSAFLEDRFDLGIQHSLMSVPGITLGGLNLEMA